MTNPSFASIKRALVVGIIGLALPLSAMSAHAATAITSRTSHNWSGYASSGGTFTSVNGTWTVPSVSAQGSSAADSSWVGIGGENTQDLIQAGTQATVQNGSVSYSAWYEMLPAASTPISMTVHSGDSITTTIVNSGSNTWQITIKNNTTGQSFVKSVNYTSSESSAEWIEEMPSNGTSLVSLDDFGSISFTGGSATMNGQTVTIASSEPTALDLISSSNQTLATPSALGTDGESFTVTRAGSSSATGTGSTTGTTTGIGSTGAGTTTGTGSTTGSTVYPYPPSGSGSTGSGTTGSGSTVYPYPPSGSTATTTGTSTGRGYTAYPGIGSGYGYPIRAIRSIGIGFRGYGSYVVRENRAAR